MRLRLALRGPEHALAWLACLVLAGVVCSTEPEAALSADGIGDIHIGGAEIDDVQIAMEVRLATEVAGTGGTEFADAAVLRVVGQRVEIDTVDAAHRVLVNGLDPVALRDKLARLRTTNDIMEKRIENLGRIARPGSCAEFKASGLAEAQRDGVLPIFLPAYSAPREVYCDQTHDGGGWTLAMVSSDDGVDSWTWVERSRLTNPALSVGAFSNLTGDYKSFAMHDLPFKDLLFVHAPSGVWAAYHNVGDGSSSLAAFLAARDMRCYAKNETGFPLSNGTLGSQDLSGLCNDASLYIHAQDYDGNEVCATSTGAGFGPMWNGNRAEAGVGRKQACPLDDTGYSASLGPCNPGGSSGNQAGFGEYCLPDSIGGFVTPAVGFGAALGLNTAPRGSGGNNIRVYVRSTSQ